MIDQFEELREEIKRTHPLIETRLTKFPSGAVMLDISIVGETYVVEYLPKFNVFGISKVSNATFGWEGVENTFKTFEDVKAQVWRLLT